MNELKSAPYLEQAVKQLVGEVREVLNSLEELGISALHFNIRAVGRVHGDVKISYSFYDAEYVGEGTTGNAVQPAFEEMLRRKGWSNRNAPLCISYSDSPEDEIPF